jgi:hypothetical protein
MKLILQFSAHTYEISEVNFLHYESITDTIRFNTKSDREIKAVKLDEIKYAEMVKD